MNGALQKNKKASKKKLREEAMIKLGYSWKDIQQKTLDHENYKYSKRKMGSKKCLQKRKSTRNMLNEKDMSSAGLS